MTLLRGTYGAVYWRLCPVLQVEWHSARDTWEPLSIREDRRKRPPTLQLGPLGRVVLARMRRI